MRAFSSGQSFIALRPQSMMVAIAAFLGIHALAIIAFPRVAATLSDAFMLLAPVLAGAACAQWMARSNAELRLSTTLVALSFGLWATATGLDTWLDIGRHVPGWVAMVRDLAYFCYGVPLLYAISLSTAEQRSTIFLWLSGLQAIVSAYLASIVFFSGAPFTSEPTVVIPADHLAQAFFAEDLLLALAGTIRLISCTEREERRLYRILCAFLWLHLTSLSVYNAAFSSLAVSAGDVLVDVPFIAVALWFASAPHDEPAEDAAPHGSVALFVASASPLMFTFGMLALGTVAMQRQFGIGCAGVAFALGCYGLQATLLQNRYIRSQQSLREALSRLENISMTDGLTGVANRRCFDQTLEREWNRAKRAAQPISLLLVDIDFFKKLNDRYGHVYGDECLIAVAHTLRAALPRDGDLVARYGGEEFAAILPNTDRAGAEIVAAKMRTAVRRLGLRNTTSMGEIVTVSVGVSTFYPSGEASWVELIKGSDQALYRAKEEGRDRIEFYAIA